MMTVSELIFVHCIREYYWSIGAMVALSQLQYSIIESDSLLSVMIMLSSRASEDVMVKVSLSDGSANGNVEQ